MNMSKVALFYSFLVLLQPLFSSAGFGDYADHSFDCPARITCPQVCVARVQDCPTSCPQGEQVCPDGTCNLFCNNTASSSSSSPCTKSCAPVACPRVVLTYDECFDNFDTFYDQQENCVEEESAASEPTLSWTLPGFVFVYVWVISVTLGCICWNWYNHQFAKVSDATQPLQMDANETFSQEGTTTIQVGCKRHPIGSLLHIMTVMTLFGWFVIIGVMMYIFYNAGNDEDQILALKAVCISVNTGLIWSYFLYWPHSIESVFFRRCVLSEATHVAVYHTRNSAMSTSATKPTHPILRLILKNLAGAWKKLMYFVYATEDTRLDQDKGILEYCPVRHRRADGKPYFVFLFRRYIFDQSANIFVAGSWSVGETFREMAPNGIRVLDEMELAYMRAVDEGDPTSINLAGVGNPQDEDGTPSLKRKNSLSNGQMVTNNYIVDAQGLSDEEVVERRNAVGPNVIDMANPSLIGIFRKEIAKPFYLYQLYIMWIWVGIQYWYMATVCWFFIILSATIISFFRYRGELVLYKLSAVNGQADVLRNKKLQTMGQDFLVPGDIVKLSPGVVHCDMVLLTGEAVLDESALTGEAAPRAKVPIDPLSDERYDPTLHKRQTLSAGTRIQECSGAIALVLNTASYTTKGELLREILSFRKHRVQLEMDVPIAVFYIVLYSLASFCIIVSQSNSEPVVSWLLGSTAFSNAFPPLLPLSFIVPVGYSFERLASEKIACSNTDSILLGGEVSKVFFDKTGTLTEQGLRFDGQRSASSWGLGHWESFATSLAMSCCHTLSLTRKRRLIGHPVDRAMFQAVNAKLLEANGATALIKTGDGIQVEVLRRFDFDHNRMTQSVVVRLPEGRLVAIVKGSGENIHGICSPSTIPDKFFEFMESQARKGIYQIAVGMKDLPAGTDVTKLTRDEIERDIEFSGMLNFSNHIRENTGDVIRELEEANIQPIMLTGDSLYTGIHVARECGLIGKRQSVIIAYLKGNKIFWTAEDVASVSKPEVEDLNIVEDAIAMTGETWQFILATEPEYARKLAPFIHVYGRCSPHDKVSVVDTFVNLGFKTVMCGDGGNDCGALKAAHVGVALSDSDASIVAPFTSLEKDIASVLAVLKEGRAALASTIAVFTFIVMYGVISSYCQVITYIMDASFSDWMWVYVDGVQTICFSLTLPLALPALKLSKSRPTPSIASGQTGASIVGMILICFAFAGISLSVLKGEDWYKCRKWNADAIVAGEVLAGSDNYEVEVLFLIVCVQQLGAAVATSFGYEFRRSWYRNYVFVAFVLGFSFWLAYIVFVPGKLSCYWRVNCTNENVVRPVDAPNPTPIGNPFATTVMPVEFRWKLFAMMVANVVALAGYDYFVVNGLRRRKERLSNDQDEMKSEKNPRSSFQQRETTQTETEMNTSERTRRLPKKEWQPQEQPQEQAPEQEQAPNPSAASDEP